MPGVAQRVECPNCWHCFNPTGRSVNRHTTRPRTNPERHQTCEHCSTQFATTNPNKRFCNRTCQQRHTRSAT